MSLTVDDPTLEPLPPSAKLVYLILEQADEESLHFVDVRDRARLPDGTTHNALARLVETGAVVKKQDFGDAGRRRYRARTAGADAVDDDHRPVPGSARGEPRG